SIGNNPERIAEIREGLIDALKNPDGYLAWLDDVLDIRPTANQQLDASQYDFKVFDTPEALHAAIAARNQNNKARVVAGYCWPWRSKKDPRQQDIVIGDY
ncbi:DNA/RNA helicase domain-containing protein, partial [Pseudomonas aeruginosa]|uniref:DNA/RNA helicase domain-containing protein n=1 Tax=Pseudomonas aeruginosa TaxID=287 RepID=UPI0031B7BDBE